MRLAQWHQSPESVCTWVFTGGQYCRGGSMRFLLCHVGFTVAYACCERSAWDPQCGLHGCTISGSGLLWNVKYEKELLSSVVLTYSLVLFSLHCGGKYYLVSSLVWIPNYGRTLTFLPAPRGLCWCSVLYDCSRWSLFFYISFLFGVQSPLLALGTYL